MRSPERFAIQPGWRLVFTDAGIDPASVLALAGLPADLFSRAAASLSEAEYFQFWRAIEAVAGEVDVPVRLGKAISIEAFDPAIFASLCSADLNHALFRMSDFKRLIGPLKLKITVEDACTKVAFSAPGADTSLPRSLVAFEFIFMTQLARLATRHSVSPIRCDVVELPVAQSGYDTFLGCDLTLGHANAITFAGEDARRPFLTESIPMWNVFEPNLRQRLSQLEVDAGLRQRVHAALLDMLPSGRTSVAEVAQRLAMSRRSLQRHLEDEGAIFRDILNSVRKELAEYYLQRSTLPVAEVSYLLGFEDSNSFQRAFKGWTGHTVGQVRAMSVAGD